MYNESFIDIMDKINSLAKSMNYTNGIAWARFAMDHQIINSYDYSEFENCHHLRNLMAHGHLRDIKISSETMQLAKMFHLNIRTHQIEKSKPVPAQTPLQTPVRSTILQEEERLKSEKLIVKEGDYVIAMQDSVYYRNPSTTSSYRFFLYDTLQKNKVQTFLLGDLFKVVGKEKKLLSIRQNKEYTIDQLSSSYYTQFFVFRGSLPDLKLCDHVYIISTPELFRNADGQCMIRMKYDRETNINSLWHSLCTVQEREGYLAHPDCFKEVNPKPLFAMGSQNRDEYLGIAKPKSQPQSASPYYNSFDDDDSLPF